MKAKLHGKRVRLRPLEPSDYAELRRVELGERLAFRWRHHGRHDAPESFAAAIWEETLVNFVVESHDQTLGLISAYGADFATGTCYVAAARFDEERSLDARFMGALALAIDYLFFGWPFRKLYFETPEYNLDQFGKAVGWILQEEGRLGQHVFLGDRYWDQIILAVWRDPWGEHRETFLRFA